jgi:hypothetical protein
VRRLQIERLRSMTMEQRHALTESLTAVTVQLSREAIAARMPGATRGQVLLRWIALVYGDDLAARVAPFAEQLGEGATP